MKNFQKSGFTMIELIMVIFLVSILGSTLLPQLADFRKEAKAAVVRQALAAMRTGLKMQMNQMRLRCNQTVFGAPWAQLMRNDITWGTICTASQVPNAAERKFWDGPTSDVYSTSTSLAHAYTSGVDLGTQGAVLPANPFATDLKDSVTDVDIIVYVSTGSGNPNFESSGGRCAWVSLSQTMSGQVRHWVYHAESDSLFAGTNTPGINECDF